MRVLITGATGKWGRPVCKAFLENGFNVRLLLHRKKATNISANCECTWGDVFHPGSLKKALENVDAVVHLAGIIEPFTEENPQLAYRFNVGGTQAMVDTIKEMGGNIPFIFPSTVAVFGACPDSSELLHPDRTPCNPRTVYAKTKVQCENLIKESGIDYLILRLTVVPYVSLNPNDVKRYTFSIPLNNRIEFCHPDDAAMAVVNGVKHFDKVKGSTLIVAGGPSQQMLYRDMLSVILGVFKLPLPPEHKFTTEPYDLHWYDTSRSNELLQYQHRTLDDYGKDLANQFPKPLITVMQRFIGPVFGKYMVRLM